MIVPPPPATCVTCGRADCGSTATCHLRWGYCGFAAVRPRLVWEWNWTYADSASPCEADERLLEVTRMATQIAGGGIGAYSPVTVKHLGMAAALLVAGMALAGFVLGILTPPRSGPWCTGDCTAYPYADAGRFFPRDYWWMLPGITLAPLFLAVAACVHFSIPPARRIWTLLAVCCATAAATLIALDYSVQVLVVQPSLSQHESDGVAMLTQYNPHGLFLVMEDLGYLLLGKAILLLAMALPSGKPVRSLRWTLAIVGGLAVASLVFFAVRFGVGMALPFELALIAVVWTGLVPIGILMAVWFWRQPPTAARLD